MIVLLLGTTQGLVGQHTPNFHLQHYDTRDGLSNNWVSALATDSSGYLWVATQYGVNRFDGHNFRTYTYNAKEPAGLAGNWARSLIVPNEDELWIGTYGGGISVINPQTDLFTPHPFKAQFKRQTINGLYTDNHNNTYVSTYSNVFSLTASGELNIISSERSNAVVGSLDQHLFIATPTGLEVKTATGLQDTLLFADQLVGALRLLSPDSLLIVIQDQLNLLTYQEEQWQLVNLDLSVSTHPQFFYLPFIFQDRQEQIWLAGEDRLWCLSRDLKKRYYYLIADLLSYKVAESPTVHCMLEDKNGILWIGTNQGLLQLSPIKPFRHPQLKGDGGRLPNTRGITALGKDYLFTNGEDIRLWNNKLSEPVVFAKNKAISPYRSRDGKLYCLLKTDSPWQLTQIKPSSQELISLPCTMTTLTRWKIIKEDLSGRLWIADWKTLLCYDPRTQHCFEIKLFDPLGKKFSLQIIDILLDRQDRLWIGSPSKGLLQIANASQITALDSISYKNFQHTDQGPNPISSSLVQALHEDKDGQIWIGTDGGLNRYTEKPAGFEQWLRSRDMPDDKILDIESDQKGTLWLSTASHGILSFEPTKNQFINYTQRDGLYSDDMLIGSAFTDKDGRIWMGSSAGLHSFLPEEIQEQVASVDTLVWQEITIHQGDSITPHFLPNIGYLPKMPFIINPGEHNAILSFAWLNFRYTGRQQYQYQLEGLSNDWLPALENGQISLSQLPPGRYTLRVTAKALGVKAQAISHPIFLRVLPPWYRTKLAYVLYTLLLFSAAYLFYQTQLTRRLAAVERQQAEELVASKLRFFQQIAHEFRSPLTLVFGAVEQIKSRLANDTQESVKPQLTQLKEQATYLTRQVDEILELAKLQADRSPLNLQTADFIQYQRFLLQSFNSVAETQNIELVFQTNRNSLLFPFDADKWRKITSNLISNALKFTPRGGQIQLTLKVDVEEKVSLLQYTLEDNGQGIAPEFLPHLFETFSQEEGQQKGGTGIGLALTKALVEQHHGKISVESKPGHGSRFLIQLPINEVFERPTAPKPTTTNQELPLVLIAEDHAAVRTYLQECLHGSYQIREAANGNQAWDICEKELPDLVISDVMMPGGSGLELSQRIRDNERTNHIPLILLTGKNSQADRLEGLRSGADLYLTKPFHREELLLRIEGLLATRHRLQQKYQSGDYSVQGPTQLTDTFMQQVISIINTEIDNEDFSVEAMAKQLHLSRVQLFRKIKALTDLTPTLLIRQVRLQKAQQLLRESDQSISEIAYACGFKDPAYFSRVYKERFGRKPSDERELK
ncbi:MAG: two-component regulator propeller domain-containing protein [Bacteroidota bacterium]